MNGSTTTDEDQQVWFICNFCKAAFQSIYVLLDHTKNEKKLNPQHDISNHKLKDSFVLILTKDNLQPYIKLQQYSSSSSSQILQNETSFKAQVQRLEDLSEVGAEIQDFTWNGAEDHESDPLQPDSPEEQYEELQESGEHQQQLELDFIDQEMKYEIKQEEPESDNDELLFHHMTQHEHDEEIQTQVHPLNANLRQQIKKRKYPSPRLKKPNKYYYQAKTKRKPINLNLPCNSCNEVFDSIRQLRSHIILHHKSLGGAIVDDTTCTICGKRLKRWDTFKYHMLNVHADQREGWRPISCLFPNCNKEFKNKSSLDIHFIRHHSREEARHRRGKFPEFQCQVCQKRCRSELRLIQHQSKFHTVTTTKKTSIIDPYKYTAPCICTICGKQLKSWNILQEHMFNVHPNQREGWKPLQCPDPDCNKEFKTKRLLKSHTTRVHSQEKILQRLINSSSGKSEYEYQCQVCKRSFINEFQLNKHQIKFHRVSPKIDEIFKRPGTLRQHVRSQHTPPRPNNNEPNKKSPKRPKNILCAICGASFGALYHLKIHMVRHSDERPFKCTECHEAFKHEASLVKHAVTHEPPPPPGPGSGKKHGHQRAQCSICEKYFRNQGTLQIHVEQAHRPLPALPEQGQWEDSNTINQLLPSSSSPPLNYSSSLTVL